MRLSDFREPPESIATAIQSNREALKARLSAVQSNDELFLRCVRKAIKALNRCNDTDNKWLQKWLPIIYRKLNNDVDEFF